MNTHTHPCLTDEDLGRLWEGEVAASQHQALQAHIDGCPDCRRRWDAVAEGGRQVASLWRLADGPDEPPADCPDDIQFAAYVDGVLATDQAQKIEAHLARCAACREQLQLQRAMTAEFAAEGSAGWDGYVATQLLRVLALAPQAAEEMATALQLGRAASAGWPQVMQLPILQPADQQQLRLAAATGEGFAREVCRQADPPFEFETVQLGHQLRVHVRALEADPPLDNCLGWLRLTEGDTELLSRFLLIEQGSGQCLLPPETVEALRPQRERLAMRFDPVMTLAQLSAAKADVYRPILQELLTDKEPTVRRAAIEVLARIAGPAAAPLLQPLVDDPDETVRTTAWAALQQIGPP